MTMSNSKETNILINDKFLKSPEDNVPENRINILCLDLTRCSTLVQFFSCCFVVFVFYLAYGYFLELIFTNESVKPISLYITLVQFMLTLFFSFMESLMRHSTTRRVPLHIYFVLAGLTLGTMAFSNLALSYLNYPTQLIFKSCKLLPVMIGSILIQGKRYKMIDYITAVIMCIGLTMFTLADSKTSPNFDVIGVIIITLALLCDAVIGNLQEKIMKQYNATNNEVVFYSYLFASFYLFVFLFFNGKLKEGFLFCMKDPVTMYSNIIMLSLSGYTGLQAVLTLVRICGAPITVTVTTMRKALSIIISFLLFSKPFVLQYLWSGLLVVLAIYLNMVSKRRPDILKKLTNLLKHKVRSCYLSEYNYLKTKTKYQSNIV